MWFDLEDCSLWILTTNKWNYSMTSHMRHYVISIGIVIIIILPNSRMQANSALVFWLKVFICKWTIHHVKEKGNSSRFVSDCPGVNCCFLMWHCLDLMPVGVIEGESGHSIILDELNYWLPLLKYNASSDPYL